jgi:hypothetical protein
MILGFLPLTTCAQNLADVGVRMKYLQKGHQFNNDTAGLALLPKLSYRCASENPDKVNFYHVADLNRDGLNDVIYSGPCASKVQTGIFINTGKGYKKLYEYEGQVVSVDSTERNTLVNILKRSCCCEFYSQYIQISIDNKLQITKNVIVFNDKTVVNVAGKLKKEKVVGTVRTSPQVNDVVKRDACNNSIKGNQLTRIHEFRDVIQLNKVGPWWLVLYPENSERSWLGWMKLE